MFSISKNFRNVLTLVSGTAMAGLISVGLLPVITRLYSAEEFGILALILSFIQFWVTLQLWRYEQSIFIAKTQKEIGYILVLCFGILVVMTVLGILFFTILHHYNIFGYGVVPEYFFWIIPLVTFGLGTFLLLRNLNIRLENYKNVSLSTVYRVIGDFATKIGLGYAGYGVGGLFIGELVGAWFSTWRLFKLAIPSIKNSFYNISYRRLYSIAKRNKNFPMIDLPSAILDKMIFILPVPMIMILYGPFEAGLFAMSYRIAALPCSKVASAFGDVFQAEFSQKIREKNISGAISFFYSSLKKYLLFALIIFLASVILPPLLAATIFGDEWADIGNYIAIMALWHFFAFFISPLSRIIPVLRVSKYKFIYDISALVLSIFSYLAMKVYDLNILLGIGTLTFANSLAYLIYLGVLIMIIKKQKVLV